MIFLGIIIAIVMFSLIILVHEWGHFSAARFFGVKVEEFWLGIPPRAKKLYTDKKWTLYSLNWLPIGWFVRLKWEDPHSLSDKQDPEALINKPFYAQTAIILGWVFMNFVLASFIFAVLFMVWIKPIWINDKIATSWDIKLIPTYEQAIENWILLKDEGIKLYPTPWSIAQAVNIPEGALVIKINNKPVSTPEEFIKVVSANASTLILFELEDRTVIEITPSPEWKIWSYIWENIEFNTDFEYKYWVIKSLWYWVTETYHQSILTLNALSSLVRKIIRPETPVERSEAIKQVSGPIWIVDFISSSFSNGMKFLLIISAIISINLWVFNLLPIPALDGWRFVFIALNSFGKKVFGKKAMSENLENIIHVWFFVLLIVLSILIAYNDILKILN